MDSPFDVEATIFLRNMVNTITVDTLIHSFCHQVTNSHAMEYVR